MDKITTCCLISVGSVFGVLLVCASIIDVVLFFIGINILTDNIDANGETKNIYLITLISVILLGFNIVSWDKKVLIKKDGELGAVVKTNIYSDKKSEYITVTRPGLNIVCLIAIFCIDVWLMNSCFGASDKTKSFYKNNYLSLWNYVFMLSIYDIIKYVTYLICVIIKFLNDKCKCNIISNDSIDTNSYEYKKFEYV